MPNNNPSGTNQYTKNGDKRPGQQGSGQHGGGDQQSGGTPKDSPNNFANDPDKAREAGRTGGKS